MRTFAVGRGDRRGDPRLALHRQPVRHGHRGVQPEGAVQFQRPAGLAEGRQGDGAAQGRVGGIAHRRRQGEAVQAAAADDHHQLLAGRRPFAVGPGSGAEKLHGDAQSQRAQQGVATAGVAASVGGDHRR